MTTHHELCEYWCECYSFDCTCGATRPKAEWFDEMVAARPAFLASLPPLRDIEVKPVAK